MKAFRLFLFLFLLGTSLSIGSSWAEEISPPLSISIAVPKMPQEQGKRVIELFNPRNYFHVVLTNTSNHELKLWSPDNAWGYSNLSFEATDTAGKTWIVKKKPKTWPKKSPETITLKPQDQWVLEVGFSPEIWEKPPLPTFKPSDPFDVKGSKTVSLKARYEIKAGQQAKEQGVWTGKTMSEKQEYTIEKLP